jgi:hypothetical protein
LNNTPVGKDLVVAVGLGVGARVLVGAAVAVGGNSTVGCSVGTDVGVGVLVAPAEHARLAITNTARAIKSVRDLDIGLLPYLIKRLSGFE